MKAVLIGQPEEVCADTIEENLYNKLECEAVWNIHKLPNNGFGPVVKILASLPAVIMSDVAVLLPGYRKNWYTYFEYLIAKILFKVVITYDEVVPIEIKYDTEKNKWRFSTQFLNFKYSVNMESEKEERLKTLKKKESVV